MIRHRRMVIFTYRGAGNRLLTAQGEYADTIALYEVPSDE